MRLALEWCRQYLAARSLLSKKTNATDAVDFACDALDLGSAGADDLRAALPWTRRGDFHGVNTRLLRARLALYLRAVLRADERERSDDGWNFATLPVRTVVCDRCAQVLPFYEVGDVVNVCPADGKPARARYARPLWELAPSSGRGR